MGARSVATAQIEKLHDKAIALLDSFAHPKRKFHNPLTDKKQRLMSQRESFFSVGLPAIAALIPIALLTALNSLAAAFLFMPLALIPLVRFNTVKKLHKEFKNCASYDLSTTEDRKRLREQLDLYHPGFVDGYIALTEKSGLEKPPRLFIGDEFGDSAQAFNYSFAKKDPCIFLPAQEFLFNTASVLSTAAHEMAHIKFRDTLIFGESRALIILPILGATASSAFLCLAPSLVFTPAGVLALNAGAALVVQKNSRYCERRCDRFSAMITGHARTAGLTYMEAPVSTKTLHAAFAKATKRTISSHPQHAERRNWLFRFEEENARYCYNTRQDLALRASNVPKP